MKALRPTRPTQSAQTIARRFAATTAGHASALLLALLLTGIASVAAATAEEEPDPQPPANRPNAEELRARFRNLTPAEREARLRELRARLAGGTNRAEIERRREEWRRLPPAEREARLRELRERNLAKGSPLFNQLTPKEREVKRTEIKGRVDAQIKELESRKSVSPLTPSEQRRLERFRHMSRRLDQGTALGTRPELPRPAPNR